MTKETVTLKNITKDFLLVARFDWLMIKGWRLNYIIPITLIALLIGIVLNIWIGVVIFLVDLYHIVCYAIEYKNYRAKKEAIKQITDRGDLSICVEKLSHIADETVYEPYHRAFNKAYTLKNVTVFYFTSGASWRLRTVGHYRWSKKYYFSPNGLENVSIKDDEFFYISLQGCHYVSYIYPCKFFELDKDLT